MGRVTDPEEEARLLPIDEWRERILAAIEPLDPVRSALDEAWGCVLAGDVVATADLPGFTSSAMDGFAVRAADIADVPADLQIVGEVRMGQPASVDVGRGEAMAIPTGGVVPGGADAVVPIEFCAVEGDRVRVLRAVDPGKHVRPAGEDARKGDALVAAGRRLAAPDIGAIAAAGIDVVSVRPRARVGILSTGDELVAPGQPLQDGQVYDSNGSVVAGAVLEAGAVPIRGGIVRDDPAALNEALDRLAPDVDAFVCSGGVSAGERDPVKRAFLGGGDIAFANVAMQPGRPQAFGSYRGKPFFGLPGNPVSVFVSFVVFAEPAVRKLMGLTGRRAEITAALDGELEAPRTRTRYARVRVRRDVDGGVAAPEGGHASNLLATFARADGLAVVPAGRRIGADEPVRVIMLREVP